MGEPHELVLERLPLFALRQLLLRARPPGLVHEPGRIAVDVVPLEVLAPEPQPRPDS